MHGKGEFIWPNGRLYKGDYVNDKREGFGEYTWLDILIKKNNNYKA